MDLQLKYHSPIVTCLTYQADPSTKICHTYIGIKKKGCRGNKLTITTVRIISHRLDIYSKLSVFAGSRRKKFKGADGILFLNLGCLIK